MATRWCTFFHPKRASITIWSASGAPARTSKFRPSEDPSLLHRQAEGRARQRDRGGFPGARAPRYSPCEMREIRPERVDVWDKPPSARKIFLDPAGKPMDSAGFARVIAKAEMEGRDLVFLIGGHDGLPAGWAARADQLVSLSAMTFPHELARAMLESD